MAFLQACPSRSRVFLRSAPATGATSGSILTPPISRCSAPCATTFRTPSPARNSCRKGFTSGMSVTLPGDFMPRAFDGRDRLPHWNPSKQRYSKPAFSNDPCRRRDRRFTLCAQRWAASNPSVRPNYFSPRGQTAEHSPRHGAAWVSSRQKSQAPRSPFTFPSGRAPHPVMDMRGADKKDPPTSSQRVCP